MSIEDVPTRCLSCFDDESIVSQELVICATKHERTIVSGVSLVVNNTKIILQKDQLQKAVDYLNIYEDEVFIKQSD